MAATEGGPKPQLARFLEAVACIMGLDEGRQRLVLTFEDGRLRRWFVHNGEYDAAELERFDAEAGWLVVKAGAL
jgi:hypothetical protein